MTYNLLLSSGDKVLVDDDRGELLLIQQIGEVSSGRAGEAGWIEVGRQWFLARKIVAVVVSR